jgi:hypothetical protein
MNEDLCAKCQKIPRQPEGSMYADFCKFCAADFKRLLDKRGLLNKLKRKKGVK